MKLHDWLSDNKILIKDFIKKIGCNYDTAKKVQDEKPVSKKIAIAIMLETHGKINPEISKVGRPKKVVNTPTD